MIKSNDTFVGCQWFNVNLQFIRFQYGRKKIQDHDSKYNTELAEESTATEETETVKDKSKESEDTDGDDDSEDEDPGGFYVTLDNFLTFAAIHMYQNQIGNVTTCFFP